MATAASTKSKKPSTKEAAAATTTAVVETDETVVVATAPKTVQEQAFQAIKNLVSVELERQKEIRRIRQEKHQIAQLIASSGLDVPPDAPNQFVPPSMRKKGTVATAMPTGKRKPGRTPQGSGGKNLFECIVDWMAEHDFVAPRKWATAKQINDFAKKEGYSSASSVLYQKAKEGLLVRGDRSEYALPMDWQMNRATNGEATTSSSSIDFDTEFH